MFLEKQIYQPFILHAKTDHAPCILHSMKWNEEYMELGLFSWQAFISPLLHCRFHPGSLHCMFQPDILSLYCIFHADISSALHISA